MFLSGPTIIQLYETVTSSLKFETNSDSVEKIYCLPEDTCADTPRGMHIPWGWGGPQCGDCHYMQLPTGALIGKEQLDYQMTPYRLMFWTQI